MNAQPHAIAHTLATALAHAISNGSVDAKGREGKGPHRTGPNGVFRGSEFSIHLTFPYARATNAPSDEPQHGPVRVGWMGTTRFVGGVR